MGLGYSPRFSNFHFHFSTFNFLTQLTPTPRYHHKMIIPPISKLPKAQRQQLLHDLNYLNTAEIKSFCQRHSIPYTIAIETSEGQSRKTNEDDRKGVILNRIRLFLADWRRSGRNASSRQNCMF